MTLAWLMQQIQEHKPNEIRMSSDVYLEFCRIIKPRKESEFYPVIAGITGVEFDGIRIEPFGWWYAGGIVEFVYRVDIPKEPNGTD